MENDAIRLLSAVGFLVLLALLMVWGLSMQRRALTKQSDAMTAVDESLELSRQSAELANRMVELAEESALKQAEIVRLLSILVEQAVGRAEPLPSDKSIKVKPPSP